MRYNLCSCCVHFAPEIKDAEKIVKKHCKHSSMEELFGIKHGFPSGVDIIHCDCFQQPPAHTADVVYCFPNMRQVGYIVPSLRPKTRRAVGELYDNSKTQKIFKVK